MAAIQFKKGGCTVGLFFGFIGFTALCGVALLIGWLNKPKDKTGLWVLMFLWVAMLGVIVFFVISLIQFMSHI